MEKCPLCKGRGMQVHIQQIGPGMVQQIQTVCIECKGQGERINPKDRCESCSGAKVVREKKIIEVHVEKGEAVWTPSPASLLQRPSWAHRLGHRKLYPYTQCGDVRVCPLSQGSFLPLHPNFSVLSPTREGSLAILQHSPS